MCVLVNHYLGPYSGRGSRAVIWIYCQVAGGQPWGRSVEGGFCVLSWRCHICLSWNPRWLQSDCKENCLEQRQVHGGRDTKPPVFSNSWAQEGVSTFRQKQFEHLSHHYLSHSTTIFFLYWVFFEVGSLELFAWAGFVPQSFWPLPSE
jgi:hypothetical protein